MRVRGKDERMGDARLRGMTNRLFLFSVMPITAHPGFNKVE